MSARAIATRCCWPPESWLGWWSSRPASPTISRQRRACSSRSFAECAVRRVDQRQLDVLERRGARQQVERLEDEPDLAVADLRARRRGRGPRRRRRRGSSGPTVGPVEAADDVHERALAGARRAHDGDELARRDRERHAVQGAHLDLAHAVDADEVLDADDVGRSAIAQKRRGPPPGARAHAGRGAVDGVRLRRDEADDDRVALLQVSAGDLRETPVGDPGADLDRLRLAPWPERRSRRPSGPACGALLAAADVWSNCHRGAGSASPAAVARRALLGEGRRRPSVSSGRQRSAALGTRRTSCTTATSMMTLAVMLGRSARSGFGTSTMTG